MDNEKLYLAEKEAGLHSFIPKNDLIDVFKTALGKQRLILGTIYTTPGPKMFFQGDDEADLSYFKFFREFSTDKEQRKKDSSLIDESIKKYGYDYLEELARPDSIVGRIKPQGLFKDMKNQMVQFTQDLKTIIDKNDALLKGDIITTYKDNNHNVHIHHLKSNNEEILVIKNFGWGFHNKEYSYSGFPNDGKVWEEIFSSDDEKYGGMGFTNKDRKDITNYNQNLSLAPNSFTILKKIN